MADLTRVSSLALAGRVKDAEKALGEPESFEERWWGAYLANAAGRYGDAIETALHIAEESRDASLASRALITAASALRQESRHLAARPLDESAFRLAPDDATRAHALIGLAADAVGLGRDEECAAQMDDAARIAPVGDWRTRVRLAWVRCEHALMTSRARKAITHARDALDRSREAGAQRHEAKSLLFLGIAQREAGDPGWDEPLRRAAEIAKRLGATPIAEVARAALPARSSGG